MNLTRNYGLGILIHAKNNAKATLAGFRGDMSKTEIAVKKRSELMKSHFTSLAAGAVLAFGGLAVLSLGKSLADAAGVFEQKMASLAGIARAGKEEFIALKNAAIEAGIETQFSPNEAVEGLEAIAAQGRNTYQAISMLPGVLDLAAGSRGKLSVEDSAKAISGTIASFGLDVGESGLVADKLLRVTQLTNFQAEDFSIGLSKAAAIGGMYGQTMDDLIVSLGAIRNLNVDASSSATFLRNATMRVYAQETARKELRDLEIDTTDKLTGKRRDLAAIMYDVVKETKHMAVSERDVIANRIFGIRGAAALVAVEKLKIEVMRDNRKVTLRGAEAYEHLVKSTKSAKGASEEFRKRLLDTYEGQKTLLRGTMQTWAILLGEPFSRVLKPIVGATVNVLNALLRAFKALPDPVKDFFAKSLLVAGVVATLAGGLIALKGALGLAKMGLAALTSIAGGATAALGPIAAVLAGLVAVGSLFYMAYKHNLGGFGDMMDKVKDRVVLAGSAISQVFSKGGFWGDTQMKLNLPENSGIKRFVIGLKMIAFRGGQIGAGFSEGFKRGLEKVEPAFLHIKKSFGKIIEVIGKAFSSISLSSGMLNVGPFEAVGKTIASVLTFVINRVVDFWSLGARFWGGVFEAFDDFGSILGPAFDTLLNAFAELGGAFAELFNLSGGTVSFVDVAAGAFGVLGRVIGWSVSIFVTVISYVASFYAWIAKLGVGILSFAKDGLTTLWNVLGSLKNQFGAVTVGLADLDVSFSTIMDFLREEFPNVADVVESSFNFITSVISSIGEAASAVSRFIDLMLFKGKRGIADVLELVPDTLLSDSLIDLKQSMAIENSFVPHPMPQVAQVVAQKEYFASKEALQADPKYKKQTKQYHFAFEMDGQQFAKMYRRIEEDEEDRVYKEPAYGV